MSSNEYQTPDLATILKTLASLPPASQWQQSSSIAAPLPPNHPPTQQDRTQQQPAWPPHDQPAAPKNLVDPATITDWSSGLRCIMKTAAKHENMLNDIRKVRYSTYLPSDVQLLISQMIKVQHEHEEQWWKGREELVKRQQAREENQKKLDDVLQVFMIRVQWLVTDEPSRRAVGGAVSTENTNVSPGELARELETFDMKVHRAQTQMVKEMTARLRNLGVPFFGTRSELVIPDGKEEKDNGSEVKKVGPGMILEADLMKLQRKMLAMLEDLCNELEHA